MSILDDNLAAAEVAIAKLTASLKTLKEAVVPQAPDKRLYTPHRFTAYREVEYDVTYDWQPPEKATNGYSGCDMSATVTSVLEGGVERLQDITGDTLSALEDECVDHALSLEQSRDEY